MFPPMELRKSQSRVKELETQKAKAIAGRILESAKVKPAKLVHSVVIPQR